MDFDVGYAVQLLTLLTGFCAFFNYVVIRPLRLAIDDLRSMIAEVKRDTEEGRKDRHRIELQLAKVEDSAKSAHHRIDSLEQRS